MTRKIKARLIEGSQYEKFDSELLLLAKNYISHSDVKTRKYLWKQKIIVYRSWDDWTFNKGMLPLVKKYQEIKERVIKDICNISKDLNLTNDCYIVENSNNNLRLIMQNDKNTDFADPRVVVFFKTKSHKFNADRCQPDTELSDDGSEQCFGWCRAQMYWPTGWRYINLTHGYTELSLKRDNTWIYHGNYMTSKGTARVQRSQLFKGIDHLACFSYCNKLGRVKNNIPRTDGDFGRLYGFWKPLYGVLKNDSSIVVSGEDVSTHVEIARTAETGQNHASWASDQRVGTIKIPNDISLDRYEGDEVAPAMPILLFLVDERHYTETPHNYSWADSGWHFSTENSYLKKETWYPLPKVFCDFPHLLVHAKVQFFFQKKLLRPADIIRCKIETEGEGTPVKQWWQCMKGEQLFLKCAIKVKSSIAGIVYHFISGDIIFRWDFRVGGYIQSQKMLSMFSNAIMGKMLQPKKTDGGWLSGFKILGRTLSEGLAGFADKWLGTDFKGGKGSMITGKDIKESTGTGDTHQDRPETEQQGSRDTGGKQQPEEVQEVTVTQRTASSDGDFDHQITPYTGGGSNNGSGGGDTKLNEDYNGTLDSKGGRKEKATKKTSKGAKAGVVTDAVKLATEYVNTVRLEFNFWEFMLYKMESNPFEMQFEFSDELLENIKNNNNATVNHCLDVKFRGLQQIIRRGENQLDVNLFWDMGDEYSEALSRGVYFYADKEEDFPDLKLERIVNKSVIRGLQDSIDIGGGGEQWIERIENVFVPNSATTSAGTDHTAIIHCGAYVRGSTSYIFEEGGSGENLFHRFHSLIPASHWHGGSPDSVTGTWRIKNGSENEITLDLGGTGEKKWRHRVDAYNTSNVEEVGYGNQAILKYAVNPERSYFELTVMGGGHTEQRIVRELKESDAPRNVRPAEDDIIADNPPSSGGDPNIDIGGIDATTVEDQEWQAEAEETYAEQMQEAEGDEVETQEQFDEDTQDLQADIIQQQQEEQDLAQEQQQEQQDQTTEADVIDNNDENTGQNEDSI